MGAICCRIKFYTESHDLLWAAQWTLPGIGNTILGIFNVKNQYALWRRNIKKNCGCRRAIIWKVAVLSSAGSFTYYRLELTDWLAGWLTKNKQTNKQTSK